MTRQSFVEQLVQNPGQAGTSFGTYTTAKTVIPATSLLTIPANFFDVGKALRITVKGGIGTLVTTPGTVSFQCMLGPTGTIIAFTTGAIQMNATAHTDLPFSLDVLLICRAIGASTSANLMGMAVLSGVMFTLTAAQVDGVNSSFIAQAPAATPTVGTGFDSTVANLLDFYVAFSISSASNTVTVDQYMVESLN